MEAQKIFEDEEYKNKEYAKLCGISSELLLELEYHFLELFDFTLNISEEEFQNFKTKLINLL